MLCFKIRSISFFLKETKLYYNYKSFIHNMILSKHSNRLFCSFDKFQNGNNKNNIYDIYESDYKYILELILKHNHFISKGLRDDIKLCQESNSDISTKKILDKLGLKGKILSSLINIVRDEENSVQFLQKAINLETDISNIYEENIDIKDKVQKLVLNKCKGKKNEGIFRKLSALPNSNIKVR